MTPADLAAILAAIDKFKDLGIAGVVMAFCAFILIRDDRRSSAREDAMRKSFEARETKFTEAMASTSDKFIEALKEIVQENTGALKELTSFVKDSLAEMRREIGK